MLCLSLVGPTLEDLKSQLACISCDLIEFRFDLFSNLDPKKVAALTSLSKLFTLRNSLEGTAREEALLKLLEAEPEWLDIEYPRDLPLLSQKSKFPKTKFLLSYHAWESPKRDLIEKMVQYPVEGIKYAESVNSTLTALELIHTKIPGDFELKGLIPMGEMGSSARVLAPLQGLNLQFASLKHLSTAPGQLTLEEMQNLYPCNKDTVPFALIGDPVHLSRGHLFHNKAFQEKGQNRVYLKCLIRKEELQSSIPLFKKMGFGGLSVTMPHKETIIPFLDELDVSAKDAEAVNTVLFRNHKAIGLNTDGEAALKLLQEKSGDLKGKTILLFGGGGTAKAIASALLPKKPKLVMAVRTPSKIEHFAKEKNISLISLKEAPLINFDIVINATSSGMNAEDPFSLFPLEILKPHHIVMDVVYPKLTELICKADELGSLRVIGLDLFLTQASLQQQIWENT